MTTKPPLPDYLDVLVETNPETARGWIKNRETECRACLSAARDLVMGQELTGDVLQRAPDAIVNAIAAYYTQAIFNDELVALAVRAWPAGWPNDEIVRTERVAEMARNSMTEAIGALQDLRDFVSQAHSRAKEVS